MQVARIELPDLCQPAPIPDHHFAVSKVDRTRSTQLLQGAVNGGHRHAERFSQLNQGDGRRTGVIVRQAGGAGAIEQFAEQVRHPRRHGPGAVVGDGFPEDGGIDQCFPPDGKPDRRPAIESCNEILVRYRRNEGRADRTDRVIHLVDEQRLRVRHIAGHVKRDVLPAAIRQQVISRHHSRHHQRGDGRIVALPDQVFVRRELSDAVAERAYLVDILLAQARMLLEFADQYLVRLRQDRSFR